MISQMKDIGMNWNDSEIFLFDPKTRLERECVRWEDFSWIISIDTNLFSSFLTRPILTMLLRSFIIELFHIPMISFPPQSSSSSSSSSPSSSSSSSLPTENNRNNQVISSHLLWNQIQRKPEETHWTLLWSKWMSKRIFSLFFYSHWYFQFPSFSHPQQ